MSKMSRLKSAKKAAEKVIHSTPLHVWVSAGLASPGPPLGPQLGQRGINIAQFCKDFNERTKDYRMGVPIPCTISLNPDRSYNLHLHKPPLSYFIRQASGAERGAMNYRNETVGLLSVKQVYEIALVKSQDIIYDCVPLQKICREIIDEALFMGVKVVDRIDEKEYALFLEERKKIVAKQLANLDEIRQARMMRTT